MASSTNQLQKPVTMQVNNSGNLEIGGCDLVALAEKYSTPLYVLDEKTIRSICKDYKKAFEKYPKTHMMYASKALCTEAVAKIVDSEGFGFDTVSGGEIYTDNFLELALLNEIAKSKNKIVDVLLRITPGIECHTHEYIQTGHLDSKFGFDLTQIDEAVELILNEYKNIKLHGLHAHIGSQIFETSIYPDEIEILVKEIVRLDEKYNLKLDEINIGGGLGVKYTEADLPPSTYDIGELIINKLHEVIEKYSIEPPTVFLEPGRSII